MNHRNDPTAPWLTAISHGCRVLVAEPNDTSAAVATGFLDGWGAVPIRVNDEDDALLAVTGRVPAELILLTVSFGKARRASATVAKIRDLESKTSKWRTPIIALSTLTRTELSSACDGMDFDGYVPIPFSSTELFAVIGQYIDLNSDRVQRRILTEFSEALDDTDDFLPPLH